MPVKKKKNEELGEKKRRRISNSYRRKCPCTWTDRAAARNRLLPYELHVGDQVQKNSSQQGSVMLLRNK